MRFHRSIGLLAFVSLSTTVFAVENQKHWSSWRGPLNTGSIDSGEFPDSVDAKYVKWKAELPGKGCSTPISLDENIFLTSSAKGMDAVLSFDSSGKQRWITSFAKEDPGKHRNGSGSNASPVTDGKLVYVYFKSGTFAALDLNGKVIWQMNLVEQYGKDTLFWDHGTSPALTEKYVIMSRMHQGESWIAAFEKNSGKLAWKIARNYSVPVECDHGYTTPLIIQYNGKESILTWGAEHVTIHDASTGEMTWSCGNFNPDGSKLWPAIASPVIVDDIVVIAYGRNDRGIPRLHGIKLAGNGDTTATNHVWKRDDVGTFVPTPAIHQGNVILVRDHGEVESVNPKTGQTNWKGAFPKSRANFYSSPLVAGDKVIAPREDGVVFVGKIHENQFSVLSETDLGEPIIGSPIPLNDNILIRGEKHLYCFGK
jgi:outer membrane protein assembly factor BamB